MTYIGPTVGEQSSGWAQREQLFAPLLQRKPLGWGEWVPAPWRHSLCTDAQTQCPRERDILPEGTDLATPPKLCPDWLREGTELRSQSSGGSCSFGSNCCILSLSPCHSAWFGAHNLLLGHPLKLTGCGSPEAPQSPPRPLCCWAPGLGIGLLHSHPHSVAQAHTCAGLPGLASEPWQAVTEAGPALSARALCQGLGCPRARTNVYTAGTCVSSVLLLLNVYLLQFPCGQCPPQLQLLVGAAGTTGKPGALLGPAGSRPSAPTLLSLLEMSSASSCHIHPTCQLSAPLSALHLHLCSTELLASLLGRSDHPQLSLWSCLLVVHIPPFTCHLSWLFIRHQLMWHGCLNPNPSFPSQNIP